MPMSSATVRRGGGPAALRRGPLARCAPALAALGAAVVGLVNVVSALTPNIHWRGRLLMSIEPVSAMRLFHALALPAGAALLIVAPYVWCRRRRAWWAAVLLMLALGTFDLLKGFDFEETAITWAAAALLLAGRRGFPVRHDPITLRSAVWRVPLLGLAGLASAALATWASQGHPSFSSVLAETGDLLRWQPGPIHFHYHSVLHHHFAWIPLAVHLVELGTLVGIAYVVFRPLAAPRSLPGPAARHLASGLVQAHGQDTLSFFKLRCDQHYFFSGDGAAFVGYRIENGVLLLAGDPVGSPEAVAPLMRELRGFADSRGLKLGGVGASERLRPLYESLGLKTLYLGDEAVIELDRFSLEGRPIRKVRQSVTRLGKAGYTAELVRVGDLETGAMAEIEDVLDRGRQGAPERGFSMAMDSLGGGHGLQTSVVLARDGEGRIRGVLHLVPCYGRAAVSLSFMRRHPETPNGLTEFMVARATELLRDDGVDEL